MAAADTTDPRTSFDRAAETYNEIRPSYPSEMFDTLFRRLPEQPSILEVGPGTGQATRDLLRRGATVHAIEIGPAMAIKLREVLSTPALTITIGDFEHVTIPPRRADAVFSASAYHWITPRAQLDRPAHILEPRGVMAIVELHQVTSPDDHGFFAAAQPIYERYGEGHTGPLPPERRAVDPAIRATLDDDPRFEHVEVSHYDWNQTYRASDYRKLMLSYSVTQMVEPEARRGLLDDMERFIDARFAGEVTRPLVVTLTTATLAT